MKKPTNTVGPPFTRFLMEHGHFGESRACLHELDYAYRGEELVEYMSDSLPHWQRARRAGLGVPGYATAGEAVSAYKERPKRELRGMPVFLNVSLDRLIRHREALTNAEGVVELECEMLNISETPGQPGEARFNDRPSPGEVRPLTLYSCVLDYHGGPPRVREHPHEEEFAKLWYLDRSGARGYHHREALRGGLRYLRFTPVSAVDATADNARSNYAAALRELRRLVRSLEVVKDELRLCESGVEAFPRKVDRTPRRKRPYAAQCRLKWQGLRTSHSEKLPRGRAAGSASHIP